jgi:predicted short-subunit dehydrogenase-like oxidoreductase (DUF2520 family)
VSTRIPLLIVGPGRLGRSAVALLGREGPPPPLLGRGDRLPSADLTWLTVPDREIGAAAARVPPGGIVLHASGATDLAPLAAHPRAGSLHPLMTFPGPEVGLPAADPPTPAAVAGHPDAIAAATRLAQALGWRPFPVPGDRRAYHAAAVVAGNQATVLLGLAAEILTLAGVPPEDAPSLLAPLALQSIRNAAAASPADALTGPVARGDEAVLAAHRAAISGLPQEVQEAYKVLTRATRRLAAQRDRAQED